MTTPASGPISGQALVFGLMEMLLLQQHIPIGDM
jgi:hypothetical protein